MKKCPECNTCLDMVWILPNRYYHCWLCEVWYNVIDNQIVAIPNPLEIFGVQQKKINESKKDS